MSALFRNQEFHLLTNIVYGHILESNHDHIVFAVNAMGFNDAGLAGSIASRYWSELAQTGPKQLGEVLTHTVDGVCTFHAIVCHEHPSGGWEDTPRHVEDCLNKIDVPEDETIGVVLMGNDQTSRIERSDVVGIIGAIARSNKCVIIYTF